MEARELTILQRWGQFIFLSKVRISCKYRPIGKSVFAEMTCVVGMCQCVFISSLTDNRRLLPYPLVAKSCQVYPEMTLQSLLHHNVLYDLLGTYCSFLCWSHSAQLPNAALCPFNLSHAITLVKQPHRFHVSIHMS